MLNLASVWFSRSFCGAMAVAALTTTVAGCFGDSAEDWGDDNDDNDNDSNDDDDGAGSTQSCSTSDACPNIACLCDDGSSVGAPVNAQHCTNGACETVSQTCPDACDAFGYSWTGSVVGASSSGVGDDGNLPGSLCNAAADCAAHTCACPDGTVPDVRDCYDGVCYGAEFCTDQCCALGHC